jgi:hypothetical protein
MEKRQSLVPTGIRSPDRPVLSESPVAVQFVTVPSIYNTLGFSVVKQYLVTLGIVWKQDRKFTYEVTLRRVRVTIVAMQTQ